MSGFKNIGNNIKNILDELNVDQNWLADKLDVNQATISLWINNKRIPRMKKIQAIADVTGTTTDRILFGEDHYITKKMKAQNVDSIPFYNESSNESNIDYLQIPDVELATNIEEFFAVRISDNNMLDAHIPNNSICIFKRSNSFPNSGKIIFCSVNNQQASIKRYKSISGQTLLMNENNNQKSDEDILITENDECNIIGHLYKVILNGDDL